MDNLESILLATFCFFIGAAMVGMVVYLRGNAAKRTAGKPTDPDLMEVAHLWRNRKTNRLVVELDDGCHASVSELSASQQTHLSNAAAVLQAWLANEEAIKSTLSQGPAAAQVPPPATPPATPGGQVVNDAGSTPVDVKPVPPRPLEAIGRAIAPPPGQPTAQFKSIVAQINDVLQTRLPGSPYEAQGMALIETPDQGVVVRVGTEQYPGVEAIPDEAVRNFIKAAVAEWEGWEQGSKE